MLKTDQRTNWQKKAYQEAVVNLEIEKIDQEQSRKEQSLEQIEKTGESNLCNNSNSSQEALPR